jgi:hypothetical protein
LRWDEPQLVEVAFNIDKALRTAIGAVRVNRRARVLFTFVNRPLLFEIPTLMLTCGNSAFGDRK